MSNNGDDTTQGGPSAIIGPSAEGLNKEERRLWRDWQKRDERSALDKPQHDQSDSSQATDSFVKAQHQERRQDAQQELLDHADKAVALYDQNVISGTSEKSSTEATDSRTDLTFPPVPNTPRSLASVLSLEQQGVLENFSATLKSKGVEVLKLNRKRQWQLRYPTVSREIVWLNTEEAGDIGQCPKALVWLKRFNSAPGMSYSASSIRKEGRGGLFFSDLQNVELVQEADRKIPWYMKKKFPQFAGASVKYSFEGGERTLLFCFRSKREAELFCTAMKIMKEVVRFEANKEFKDDSESS